VGVLEVGGAGSLGLAFETTYGTYVAPTKWVPIRSESLQKVEDKIWRTPIRGVADRSGAVQGYTHIEGDIEFEVMADTLLYFLYAGRFTPAKAGAMAPYTYTFVPAHVAKTTTAAGPTTRKSLSLLVQRSQNPMGYTGINVGQYAFSLDSGLLICTASVIGKDEASQSSGVPSIGTSVPYGPGKVSLEIPLATARTDVDTFTLTHNDNLASANNLSGVRTPSYNKWGEREISGSFDADFEALTDYNDFLNQVERTVKLKGSINAASDEVSIDLAVAIMESFQVGLASLGDVVRSTSAYHAIYKTADAITYTVKTNTDIT
jgi:hypothetical protein